MTIASYLLSDLRNEVRKQYCLQTIESLDINRKIQLDIVGLDSSCAGKTQRITQLRCADITSRDGCEARSWWTPEKQRIWRIWSLLQRYLLFFFSLEANAIDFWLMASTIIGFTTEKELMKQREIFSFHLAWECRAPVERRGQKRVCVCFHQIIVDFAPSRIDRPPTRDY